MPKIPMLGKVTLVVIFNHRYDRNIAVLERLYRDRFSSVYYLVPFYDGDHPNVIPVYENSYRYQGYIAQGFRSYFNDASQHYLFVADDLLLHPNIDENNYQEHFGLDQETSFVPEPFEAHSLHNNETLRFEAYRHRGEEKFYWWRLIDLASYRHRVAGLENAAEMPTYHEARMLLEEHGYTTRPLKFTDLYGPFPPATEMGQRWRRAWRHFKWLRHYRTEYRIDYPAVASFSDVVIVSKQAIRKFAHYCGVFAANGLFVEFAVPTALLLASRRVVTEPMLKKRGCIYWSYTEAEAKNYAQAMEPFGHELHRLMENFPADKLYIHPVKLSRWKT